MWPLRNKCHEASSAAAAAVEPSRLLWSLRNKCNHTPQERGAYGVRRALILLANSAKLLRAPEGRRKLAGGGAKRNHRDRSNKIVRVPAGTPDRSSQQNQSCSGALSGRVMLSCRFRWLRFAPPPANIPRASSALGVCQQYQGSPHSIRSAISIAIIAD